MALDTFNPYLFVSAGEQSNKFLTPTYSDGIAKFQAQRAQSLTGLTVRIDSIQEGSGDPSPSNIRPISGRTGLTVTVQSGETQNTYPITWETEAGTVYGGTLDVVSGVLTVTHAAVQIKDKTWTYDSTYTRFSSTFAADDIAIAPTRTQKILCDSFAPVTTDSGIANVPINSIYNGGTNRILYVKTDTVNTAANFVSTYGEYHIVFPLATPQTYQLTPTEVRTLAGFNQIYSDAGPVIDIKF